MLGHTSDCWDSSQTARAYLGGLGHPSECRGAPHCVGPHLEVPGSFSKGWGLQSEGAHLRVSGHSSNCRGTPWTDKGPLILLGRTSDCRGVPQNVGALLGMYGCLLGYLGVRGTAWLLSDFLGTLRGHFVVRDEDAVGTSFKNSTIATLHWKVERQTSRILLHQ